MSCSALSCLHGLYAGCTLCCCLWLLAQVLPFLVHNLVDSKLTKLVCQACELAMRIYTRNLPPAFTERDLVEIDLLIVQLRDTLENLYGCPNTPKFHKFSHLTTDIKRHGHPRNYNSDLYEATHALLKLMYR